MAGTPTVLTTLKIDVNPNGITLIIEGIDTNLANLLADAGTFTVQPVEERTFDTSDVTIQSDKVISFVAPPTPPAS